MSHYTNYHNKICTYILQNKLYNWRNKYIPLEQIVQLTNKTFIWIEQIIIVDGINMCTYKMYRTNYIYLLNKIDIMRNK
jgi:hypothetical protein